MFDDFANWDWGQITYDTLQYIGIFAFAISGALVGVRRQLDLLGVIVVGASTGVGGGIIRDVMIGVNPPTSLTYWPNLTVAVTASLLVFFFHPRITRSKHFEVVFDAFGLGLFSANGAAAAFAAGLSPMTAIFVGAITAIGGGMVRDVLVNDVPGVLTRELYAVSAMLGASCAVLLTWLTESIALASFIGALLAIILRLVSYLRGWQLPKPRAGRGLQ